MRQFDSRPTVANTPVNTVRPPKLMDRLREALHSRHYSRRTEQTYSLWVRRYIHFHTVRHPAEMAEPEINALLTHLAVKEKVSASTQNQALSALLFLYRHVIGREVGDLNEVIRTIQELPGHKDVSTTMIYTHVLNRGGHGYAARWMGYSPVYTDCINRK